MEKHGVQILGQMKSEYTSILTPEAVQFAGHIQRKFGDRVLDLLQKRKERQAKCVPAVCPCTGIGATRLVLLLMRQVAAGLMLVRNQIS